MVILYIFAHFDDEYCAVPLLREHSCRGDVQHFLYVADYKDANQRARRRRESESFLARWGFGRELIGHLGAEACALDGTCHLNLQSIYKQLRRRAAKLGTIDQIVTPAWEGGHMDHDACAALAVALATEFEVPVIEQFSLYNGIGLYGPLFRAGHPLKENGPSRRLGITIEDLTAWAIGVGHYPSQFKTWLGLWPVMFTAVAFRGFFVQRLVPDRVKERPHAGRLLYERLYGVPYDEVRQKIDAFLSSATRTASDR